MKTFLSFGAFLLISLPLPASAAPTTLTVKGVISRLSALQNGVSVPVPAGQIAVGDAYTLSATFDFSFAQLTWTFDADPTINIYNLPGTSITYTIASHDRSHRSILVPQFRFGMIAMWVGSALTLRVFTFLTIILLAHSRRSTLEPGYVRFR